MAKSLTTTWSSTGGDHAAARKANKQIAIIDGPVGTAGASSLRLGNLTVLSHGKFYQIIKSLVSARNIVDVSKRHESVS